MAVAVFFLTLRKNVATPVDRICIEILGSAAMKEGEALFS